MKKNLAELSTELQNCIKDRDRLAGELAELNVKMASDPGNDGLRQRGENLVKGLEKVGEKVKSLQADYKSDVLDGIASGKYQTEDGDGATPYKSATSVHGSLKGEALRAIDAAAERHKGTDTPDSAFERATELVSKGKADETDLAARWVSAAASADYEKAFAKLVSNPTHGHLEWTPAEADAYRRAVAVKGEMTKGMLSGTDSAGGFMVPLTLDPAIVLTSAGSINPLRRISRVVQTMTDQWQGVSSAGVTAEWKAEAAQAADATPTIADEPIPVHFGDAYVPYSFEAGMDAVNLLGELQKLLIDGAEQLMATAYTTGSGSGQPTGIIKALDGTASEVAPTTAEAFAAADIYKVQNALPARFQANARWLANIATINTMAQFETTNGALQFPELRDDRLLRKSLDELSNMDGTFDPAATADNFLLLYGDFSNFVIVDRIGATLELIPHLVGANQRPTGERGALLWFRTGSDSVANNAFRVLNVATTA